MEQFADGMATQDEKDRFNAGVLNSTVISELEVFMDNFNLKLQHTSGDSQLATIVENLINTLSSITSTGDLQNLLMSSIKSLKLINSDAAPALIRKLSDLIREISSMFKDQSVVVSSFDIKEGVIRVFQQQNLPPSANPDMGERQVFPQQKKPDSGEENLENQVSDDKTMVKNEPEPTPQEMDQMAEKVRKAYELLNQCHALFSHEDYKGNTRFVKNKLIRRLLDQIMRTKQLANTTMSVMHKPRKR